MSIFRLLLRNLFFHRRGNFAVFLGVALGTAVLTGALLVGDSLRDSLTRLALDQLGWVENAMTANRFFRAELANDIRVPGACPAVLLRGSAGVKAGDKNRMVNKVTVLGVDDRFWPGHPASSVAVDSAFWGSNRAEVVLNQTLADTLKVAKGDTISLHVQKADNVPREYLLGKRRQEDAVEAVQVKVHEVLPDHGMGSFTLTPSPEPVRNAFVPLRYLQEKLDLAGRANALFTAGAKSTPDMAGHLRLEDWGLIVRTPAERADALLSFLDQNNETRPLKERRLTRGHWRGRVPLALAELANKDGVLTREQVEMYYRRYFMVESQHMLLEDAVVDAVQQTCAPPPGRKHIFNVAQEDWCLCPVFIYLADSISADGKEAAYIVVAARGPLPGDMDVPADSQIDLARWQNMPLSVKPGDEVTLSYYAPDDHSHLKLDKAKFTLRKLFDLTGMYDDPDLVPVFPGITNKRDLADWNENELPFPYNRKRTTVADDAFWKRYRTTPRAYISLGTAQKLWGNRFGKLTSFLIMPVDGKSADFEGKMALIAAAIRQKLDPEKGGFVWQRVRAQALKAGGGSTDFGIYFLAFSFFLIVASLLLIGLLFRLNLDLRGREMGILLATGWTFQQVRLLLLSEGFVLAVFGALTGLGLSFLYAELLLQYLSQKWPGNLMFLKLDVTALSLAIGWSASVIVSFLTIVWAVRTLSRMTATRLLAGDSPAGSDGHLSSFAWSRLLIPISGIGAGALLTFGMIAKGQEAQAGSFFGGGFFVLVLGLTLVWRRLRSCEGHGNPQQSLAGLAVRNAGRRAVRSVLTIGLLASATFLIGAVESFHKEADAEFLQVSGGSGGFPLYAQADVPIFEDLNDAKVRAKLTFPKDAESQSDVTFYPCRLQAGDDASCLNLYQPQKKPRILGVPRSLIERGGFSFAATLAQTEQERKNPWLLLIKPGGDEIPVFVDGTSAQYVLHKSLGEIYEVTNDRGEPVKLRIAGLFHESVFQSELVVSDASFRRLFPRQEGFSFFLIDGSKDASDKIKTAWESALSDSGLSIETTTSRLEKYLAVENTYLATFQALGGLGLLLGAAGLAIVLLRSAWERRGELALLRALGFRRQSLAWLVMVENTSLLLAGLVVGMASALLAVAPHLIGGQAHVLGLRVLVLLGLVIAVGLSAGLAAVYSTLQAPLLPALRHE